MKKQPISSNTNRSDTTKAEIKDRRKQWEWIQQNDPALEKFLLDAKEAGFGLHNLKLTVYKESRYEPT